MHGLKITDFHVPAVDPQGKIVRDSSGKQVPQTRDMLDLFRNGVIIGYLCPIPKVVSLLNNWEDSALGQLMIEVNEAIKEYFPKNPEMHKGWRPVNKPPVEEDSDEDDDDYGDDDDSENTDLE